MPQPARQSAHDQLTDRRLDALEAATVGARQVERDVDHLKITGAHTLETLVEFKAEVRERDQHTQASLTRLHERVDDSIKDLHAQLTVLVESDAREEGARAERERGRKSFWMAVAGTAGLASAITALIAVVT